MESIAALEAIIEQIPDTLTVGAVIDLKQAMLLLVEEFRVLVEVVNSKQ